MDVDACIFAILIGNFMIVNGEILFADLSSTFAVDE